MHAVANAVEGYPGKPKNGGSQPRFYHFDDGVTRLVKWLKDRQTKGGKNPRPGRVLTDEDIDHYQKIVVALNETIRIRSEIDKVIDQHGGWPDAFVTQPVESDVPVEAAGDG